MRKTFDGERVLGYGLISDVPDALKEIMRANSEALDKMIATKKAALLEMEKPDA
jgi:hypothetical protein